MLLFTGAAIAIAGNARAQFEQRAAEEGYVNLQIIGNGVLQLKDDPGVSDPRSFYSRQSEVRNNGNDFHYLDIDSNPDTFNSSTASIRLGPNTQVRRAYLHWGGLGHNGNQTVTNFDPDDFSPLGMPNGPMTSNSYDARDVKLSFDDGTTYQNVRATNLSLQDNYFTASVDITQLVKARFGTGLNSITVGNLLLLGPTTQGGNIALGGWTVQLVLEDSTLFHSGRVALFDGIAVTNNSSADLQLTDFVTPDNVVDGPVVTMMTSDGDLPWRDSVKFGPDANSLQAFSDPLHAADNLLNSRATYNGVYISDLPDFPRNPVRDRDVMDLVRIQTPPSQALPGGTTSALLRVATDGELVAYHAFGLQFEVLPSISGFAYDDFGGSQAGSAANNIFDFDENPRGGIPVLVYRDKNADGQLDSSDTLVASTETDGNGFYIVPGLPNGEYLVQLDNNDPDAQGLLGSINPLPVTLQFVAASDQSFRFQDRLPVIGVAKQISGLVINSDGSASVEFTLRAKNLGNVDLFDLQIRDNLAPVFGQLQNTVADVQQPGQYAIEVAPTISGGSQLAVNANFDGSNDINLLDLSASGEHLPVGETVLVTFTVRYIADTSPNTALTYQNQAEVLADTTENDVADGEVRDLSDNGDEVDPDGDGNSDENTPVNGASCPSDDDAAGAAGQGCENDATAVVLPQLGISKAVTQVVPASSGTLGNHDVTFAVTLQNVGSLTLNNLQISDDLAAQMGAAYVAVITAPSIVSSDANSDPVLATPFAGQFFDGTSGELASGQRITLEFVIEVNADAQGAPVPLLNTATATGAAVANPSLTATDQSDAGTDPRDTSDPAGNNPQVPGDTGGSDDPTLVAINELLLSKEVVAIEAPTSGVAGNVNVRFLIKMHNAGNQPLSNLQLQEVLDSAEHLGSAFVAATAPSVSLAASGSNSQLPSLNGQFDGRSAGDSNLFTGNDGLLAVGEQLEVTLVIEIDPDATNAPDPLHNQAVGQATGSDGAVLSDWSDTGSDPTSNNPAAANHGNGANGDSNDPTIVSVIQPAVGLAKQIVSQSPAASGTPGNFDIQFEFTLKNIGNVDLGSIQIDDDIAAQFGSSFVGMTSQPQITAGDASSNPNIVSSFAGAIFDGNSGLLKVGEMLTVQLTVEVDPDAANAPTPLQNSAVASAANVDDPSQRVSDTSDSGSDPSASTDPAGSNPNAPGDSGGSDDPTPVVLSQLQISKEVGAVATAASGTLGNVDAAFTIRLQNVGNTQLNNIQLSDALDAADNLGTAFVQIIANSVQVQLSSGSSQSTLPTLNGGFDGRENGDSQFFTGTDGVLAAGEQLELSFIAEVDADAAGAPATLRNQASAAATDPQGADVQDDSDSGSDPAGNNPAAPGDTGSGSDPTPVDVEQASIGIAKQVAAQAPAASGTHGNVDVTFEVQLLNTGNVAVNNLQIVDDMAMQFGSAFVAIVAQPVITSGTATTSPTVVTNFSNNVFDGRSGELAPGEFVVVQFAVEIDPDEAAARQPLLNSATANATPVSDPDKVLVDFSDSGSNASDRSNPAGNNPNAPGHVIGPDDPTPVEIAQLHVSKELADMQDAASSTAGHTDLTFVIRVLNTGNTVLTNLRLLETLDAADRLGNAFVAASSQRTTMVLTGNVGQSSLPTLNPAFDGRAAGQAELFTGTDGQLDPGAQLEITLIVEANPAANDLPDPMANQVTVTANDPAGNGVSDLSDSGTDPSNNNPGADGDTGGHDDATPVVLQTPAIGAAKQVLSVTPAASANVGNVDVRMQITLLNSGTAPLSKLQIEDQLAAQLGRALVAVVSAPEIVNSTADQTPSINAEFNGVNNAKLLTGTDGQLAAGQSVTVEFAIELDPNADNAPAPLQNQAQVSAATPNGERIDDLSDSGVEASNIDGQGNNIGAPGDTGGIDDPTPLEAPVILSSKRLLEKTAVADAIGQVDATFEITVLNAGNVDLNRIQMEEALAAVEHFGSAFQAVTVMPAFVGNNTAAQLPTLNASFNGDADTAVFDGQSGELKAGEQFSLTLTVRLNTNGTTAVLKNQVLVTANPANGDPQSGADDVSDLSDSGVDPESNNPQAAGHGLGPARGPAAGSATGPNAGQDDPTLLTSATISAAKWVANIAPASSGVQGNFDVEMHILMRNTGTETLSQLQLRDELGSNFGDAFIAMVAAPEVVATDATQAPSLHANYNGRSQADLLVGTDGKLASGQSVHVKLTAEIDADAANIALPLTNQATASGESPAGERVNDLTDSGTDPLTNNPTADGNTGGTNDPTPVALPSIALSKALLMSEAAQSGTVGAVDASYRLIIRNTGTEVLNHIQLRDELAAANHLGAAFVGIVAAPQIDATSTASVPPVLNAGFNGAATSDVFDGVSGELAPGQELIVTFAVEVNPSLVAAGTTLQNQAVATANPATGNPADAADDVRDLSDSGTDPISTNPGQPGDTGTADDPTPLRSASIAAVKSVENVAPAASNIAGNFDVTLHITLQNSGTDVLTNLQLRDELASNFGSAFVKVTSQPTVVNSGAADAATQAPSINASFNGSNQSDLLVGTDGELAPGQRVTVALTVEVDPDAANAVSPLTNQARASATATGPNGQPVTDLTDSGVEPLTANSQAPGDNNTTDDPTPVELSSIVASKALVGVAAAQSGVVGSVDASYRLVVRNAGNQPLNQLQLRDHLSAGEHLGAAFVRLSLAPAIDTASTAAALPALNTGFNGTNSTELFDGQSGLLEPGQEVVVTLTAEVNPSLVPVGTVLKNQALASGNPPAGDLADPADDVTDLTDAGTDPLGNNADNPGHLRAGNPDSQDPSGNDDPTLLKVASIAAAKWQHNDPVVAASGTPGNVGVTMSIAVLNNGTEVLRELKLEDALASQFGGAFIGIVNAASISDSTATQTPSLNANYNGVNDSQLLIGRDGELAPGQGFTVTLTIEVDADHASAVQPLRNQAKAFAIDPDGAEVSDLSDSGTDPANDNPTALGHSDGQNGPANDPTPLSLPNIMSSKALINVVNASSGEEGAVDATFRVQIQNVGNEVLTHLKMVEVMSDASQLGTAFKRIVSMPVFETTSTATQVPVLNPAFNASSDAAVFDGQSGELRPGEMLSTVFTAEIDSDALGRPAELRNQIWVGANPPAGNPAEVADDVTDASDTGTDPTGNNPNVDGDTGGSNDPTVIKLMNLLFALPDVGLTQPGVTVVGNVLINDIEPENHNLTVDSTPVAMPQNGTVSLGTDGVYRYTPAADFTGTDQFRYQVCDDGIPQACRVTTVTIEVSLNTPLNNLPTALDDQNITLVDTSIEGLVLANDTDPDNDALQAQTNLVSNAEHGNVQLFADGRYVYTPAPGYVGEDRFSYNACDTSTACDDAVVHITIVPLVAEPFIPPQASDDASVTLVDQPVTGHVLPNDGDFGGAVLTVIPEPVEPPQNGTVTLQDDGQYVYQPDPGYTGPDNFVYQVCDVQDPTDCALATAHINVLPVIDPKLATAKELVEITNNRDGSFTAEYRLLVRNNGNVPLYDLQISDDLSAAFGQFVGSNALTAAGQYRFEQSPTIIQNAATAVVLEAGYTGAANAQDLLDQMAGHAALAHLLVGEALVIEYALRFLPDDSKAPHPNSAVSRGDLQVHADGVTGLQGAAAIADAVDVSDAGANPDANADGVASDKPATDPACVEDPQTVGCEDDPTLLPNLGNAVQPQADNSATLVNIPVGGNLLINDRDPEGDNLSINTTPLISTGHGQLTIEPNGDFLYRPNPGYVGTDQAVVEVCDDQAPIACESAVLDIEVRGNGVANDFPVALDDAGVTLVDTPVSGTVINNDHDPEGQPLVVTTTIQRDPSNGSVSLSDTGEYVYTPAAGFTGVDSFDYQVCDVHGACDSATVMITVTGDGSDALFAGDDGNGTPVNVPVSGTVLTNDSTASGNRLRVFDNPIVAPVNGSVVLQTNGEYTYTPNSGYVGPDRFVYEVCDEQQRDRCVQATVNLLVYPADQNELYAFADVNLTQPGTPVPGQVLTNDFDPEGQQLTVDPNPTITPENGTVVLNGDGSYVYTPNRGFVGTDRFQYQVCDNAATPSCSMAWVTIDIREDGPRNDLPAAIDDTAYTFVGQPVSGAVLSNDADPEGEGLVATVEVVKVPAHGDVTLADDGTYTYTPRVNFNVVDSFVYQTCDASDDCDEATVWITIDDDDQPTVNDPPMPGDDVAITPVNVPVTLSLLDNDSDPNGDDLRVQTQLITQPKNGTVQLGDDGVANYAPAEHFVGVDQFIYEICDVAQPSACRRATAYISVLTEQQPQVGLAKQAGIPVDNGDGSFSVDYTIVIENLGDQPLVDIDVRDSLVESFGERVAPNGFTGAGQYTLPTVVQIVANAQKPFVAQVNFDGTAGNSALIDLGASHAAAAELAAGESMTLQFTLRFTPDVAKQPYYNQATVTADLLTHADGIAEVDTQDVSDSGTLTDADGDGNPSEQPATNPVCVANPEAPNCEDDPTPLPGLSAVSGMVFMDHDHDAELDSTDAPAPLWNVVVLDEAGEVVGKAVTDSEGNYRVQGLPFGVYQVEFMNPQTDVSFGMQTADASAGEAVANQPLDPRGVIYDAQSRERVGGVTLRLVNASTGVPLPDVCLLPNQQNQTTPTTGMVIGAYQFDVVRGADPACPNTATEYRLELVSVPAEFEHRFSTLIPPQAGILNATTCSGPNGLVDNNPAAPCEVVPFDVPPQAGQETEYFLRFQIDNASIDVVNNHIALDRVGVSHRVLVGKQANRKQASMGDFVAYRVSVRNLSFEAIPGFVLSDNLPGSFNLAKGSARLHRAGVDGRVGTADDIVTEIQPNGADPINFAVPLDGFESIELSYITRVGIGGATGPYTNVATPLDGSTVIGQPAERTVEVIADPILEQTTIIGVVFDDRDGDGYQDEGEAGIAGVRIATVEGLLIETDEFGRYHIAGVDGPEFYRLRNFIAKVDPATLPEGTVFTTENPRVVPLSQALMSRLNFGVQLPEAARSERDESVPAVTEMQTVTRELVDLEPVRFESGKHFIPASYIEQVRQALASVVGKDNVRLRVVGHTDNERLSANAKRIYGDNQGLSEARATEVAGLLAAQLDLDVNTILTQGHAFHRPVASNATKAGMALNRRVEVSVLYDEQVERVVREATVKRSVQLDDGAVVRVTSDPGQLEPRLNALAETAVSLRNGKTEPVTFRLYSNYNAFIDRWELEIYRRNRAGGKQLLATLADTKLSIATPVIWDPQSIANKLRVGEELFYILRVHGANHRFDETSERTLLVSSATDSGNAEQQAAAAMRIYGQNNLASQHIKVSGARVRVLGRNITQGSTLKVAGEPVVVDRDGAFALEQILPLGSHELPMQVTTVDGVRTERDLQAEVKEQGFFIVGLANVTIGQNSVSGSVEPLAADDHFDGSTYTDGRIAFYLKGKIKGKYLLTAQMDSTEDDLRNLGDNLRRKDPQSIFRRLDPDKYYPVYGDNSTTTSDVDTQGAFYLRLEWDQSQALWGNFNTGITGNEFAQYNRSLYGGQLVYRSTELTPFGEHRVQATAFSSEATTAAAHNSFQATGGSLYYLRHTDIVDGSDKLWVEVRQRDTQQTLRNITLVEGRDYDIDYLQGRVILRRPLLQVAKDELRSIISDSPLEGNDVLLHADYEYVPELLTSDRSSGVRGKVALGDRLTVGGTYIRENQQQSAGTDYELLGADATLQLSDNSNIKVEYAESESTQVHAGFISSNGGLTFDRLNPATANSAPSQTGSAIGVSANLDLSELADADAHLRAWFKQRDAGFSGSTRLNDGQKTTDVGVEFSRGIGEDGTLSLAATELTTGEGAQESSRRLVSLRVDQRFDHSDLAVELRQEDDDRAGAKTGALLVGLEYGLRISDRTRVYAGVQTALRSDAGYAGNDQIKVGIDTRMGSKVGAGLEVVSGDRGDALVGRMDIQLSEGSRLELAAGVGEGASSNAGVSYLTDNGHEVYANYHVDTDRSSGESATTTVGQRKQFGNGTLVFTEHQFIENGQQSGIGQVGGLEFDVSKTLRLGGSIQSSTLTGIGPETKRQALSIFANYSSQRVRARLGLETRKDRGASNIDQYLLSSSIDWQRSDSLTWRGRLNTSVSKAPGSGQDDARFIEGSLGFAWRPVNNDRWNVIGKYTVLHDLNSLGQAAQQIASNGVANPSERSHVFAVDVLYAANSRWEFGAKLATKLQSIQTGRDDGPWLDSSLTLAVARARYHFVDRWDALLEYRYLTADEAEQARHGALFGIYRHLGGHLKLGAGYSFTRFNDDLTRLDYSNRGWFIDLVGKF